jgi:hypothetical protein
MASFPMVHDHSRIISGWPRYDGSAWPPATLDYLSPEVREEALRVAAETLADWKQAGKPYLGQNKIKATYRYLISCPAFIEKYVRPL